MLFVLHGHVGPKARFWLAVYIEPDLQEVAPIHADTASMG